MKKTLKHTTTAFLAAILMSVLTITSHAALSDEEDNDNRIAEARVVEVTDARISVMARTGVEHVIAIDGEGTKVKIEGRLISPKDVRVGDIITIELDEKNPTKFAKNIVVTLPSDSQVARARP